MSKRKPLKIMEELPAEVRDRVEKIRDDGHNLYATLEPMSAAKQQEFGDAIERALEAKGLDPNPENLPSLEHFETALEVAAAFGLVFDTGQRSPEGKIIWAVGRRQ